MKVKYMMSSEDSYQVNLIFDCLEHKHVEYMPLTHDKWVLLTNNQYASYAFLSLAGSIHLKCLCSKLSTIYLSVKCTRIKECCRDMRFYPIPCE